MPSKYSFAIIVIVIALTVMPGLYSHGEQVDKVEQHVFWQVPHHHQQPVAIAIGDMVQLNSRNLPLTQFTMNAKFSVVYDEARLRLIASSSPDVEGPMAREVYLKAIQPGTAQVKIVVTNNNEVVEEFVFVLKIS